VEGHRGNDDAGRGFELGDVRVEPSSCRVVRGGRQIAVEPKVMALLELLASRPGEVVSKSEILERVWEGGFVVESVVTRAVSLLRDALGDDARNPTYVETIPRRGYRLVAPVAGREAADRPPELPGRPAPGEWTLHSDSGSVRLHAGETVIGRGDDADLPLDSVQVSRRHARIVVSGGRALLEDLGSKNGTRLNGRLVSGPTPLSPLDVIVVGTIRLIVQSGSSEVETETAGG
jgi:DNA-binding winged helix-turn-helix (wHTH) protein